MRGSHAELASNAERDLARLAEWYDSKARKGSPADWPAERKELLLRDLQGVVKQMHRMADIFAALTNAEQTGEYVQ